MKKKSCFIFLTAVFMMMLASVSVYAKTAIAPGIVIDQEKGAKEWDCAMKLGIYGKAKWKSGTYSAELLVPVDLLSKNNTISIEGQLDLFDASINEHEEDPYMGTATSNSIVFFVDKSGKIKIKRFNHVKGKYASFGSASVTAKKVSSGKYYLVTIKDMPFDNTYYPKDVEWESQNAKAIPTNKYLNYNAGVDISCWDKISKSVKDCIYFVSFSCNTGVKTMKVNFTGNFKSFDSWGYKAGKEYSVTRKIARVSY